MEIITYHLLEILISIISLVMMRYVIPLLKEKVSRDRAERYKEFGMTIVMAAQQKYQEPGSGEIKKKFAEEIFEKAKIKISDKERDALIESCVLKLKAWEAQFLK